MGSRKGSFLAVLAAALMLLAVGDASATNYYVNQNSPNASDANPGTDPAFPWKTPDKAGNTVKPGDVVTVSGSADPNSPAAIYNRTQTNGWPVHAPGNPGNVITIQASPGQTVILQGDLTHLGIDLTFCSHYVFRGLSFRKYEQSTDGHTNATDVLLDDCEFAQTTTTGLRLRGVTNFTMSNCYVHDCFETGVCFMTDTDGTSCSNVTVIGSVSAFNSDGKGVDGSADGFHVEVGNNVTFINCTALGNTDDGFDLTGNVQLLSCTSSGNWACNCKLWRRVDDNWALHTYTLSNCIFAGAGEAGLKISEGPVAYVNNCTIYGNGEEGIAFRAITNSAGPATMNSYITNNLIANNGLIDTSIAVRVINGSVAQELVYADYNLYYKNTMSNTGLVQDTNSLTVNPFFANPALGDFHLLSTQGRYDPFAEAWVTDSVTSPAIDAGNPASPWTLEPLPNGGRVNLGAYGDTPEASLSPVTAISISAALDYSWVYQNTPGTLASPLGPHKSILTVTIQNSGGSAAFTTSLTQTGGSGAVTVVADPGGNPLVKLIEGGLRSNDVAGVGSAQLHVAVTGNLGNAGAADLAITVRRLGDINGNGDLAGAGRNLLNLRLDQLSVGGLPDRAFDLNHDGYVDTADRVLLNKILNGQTVP